MFKSLTLRKPAKDQRTKLVLLGLIELFLKLGKPIGSNTLRENGFEDLSSATIRNYFAQLEKEGYLKQHHSSGGRIPTESAYKLYIDAILPTSPVLDSDRETLQAKIGQESRKMASYLQNVAETISDLTGCAVFLSSPRFDQDFILNIKLMQIDHNRCLCVLVTDFGLVHTEVLFVEEKLSSFMLKRIENYLHYRLTGLDRPTLTEKEEKVAANIYKEIMLRHIVTYSNFSSEDVYKTGFSKLLNHSDFNNAANLASGLSLFENDNDMRLILNHSCKAGGLCCLVGDDLSMLASSMKGCCVIVIPYHIHQNIAGAIALLGPHRIPYKKVFGIMKTASELMSDTLTRSVYKYKITFRRPHPAQLECGAKQDNFINPSGHMLLEEKKL
jgi:heat-inducible transcriptional repressor